MTDSSSGAAAVSAGGEAGSATPNRALQVLRRLPFTIALGVAIIVVGIVSGALFAPAAHQPWFPHVATGLPAFSEGRWWTVLVSPFFLHHPLGYVTVLPLFLVAIGWGEWRFGSLRALLLFFAGHVAGITVSAGILALVRESSLPWLDRLAESYDVGPSCGAFTVLVFAIATLPAPWRLRARIAVIGWTAISVLYLSRLDDLEHAVSLILALIVAGWLPAFRHPSGRPSEREWRLIACFGLIAIGVIQVLDLIVPFDGALGRNEPIASFLDVAIDVVVIALVANGVRLGHRFAWVVALILGAFNLLSVGLVFAAVPLLEDLGLIDDERDIPGLVVAPAVLWLAIMLFMLWGRGAFRVPLRHSRRVLRARELSDEETAARLQRFGGGTISWMATWAPNRRIAAAGGLVAYQSYSGVAIMLGDPIVPEGEQAEALGEFARQTQQAGLVPCVFSAGEASDRAKPDGWRSVVVAEDTIVDLPGLEFKGKRWNAVRTSINRAAREGIEFRMVRLAEEPWSTLAQVRAISEQWTGDKGLPEMRFTLGTVQEALDPHVCVGLAFDAEGNLHGVTSWLPVYGPADADGEPRIVGWTLDLMRRRDGGFGPVMEFLIASSAQRFAEEGYEFVSLSGAPLVRPQDLEAGPVDQVLEQIGGLIEPLYGFKSLHRFKQKFNPRSAPLYLLYRDEGDLPRIGIALTRAYLPDASLRDLLSAVRPG